MDEARDKLAPAEVWLESLSDEQKAKLAKDWNEMARRYNPFFKLIAEGKVEFARHTGTVVKLRVPLEPPSEVCSDQPEALRRFESDTPEPGA